MLLSAIVCTYNRCESLCDALGSLIDQQLDGGRTLEILVVDNRSADGTPRVVEELAERSRWPVRYVFEGRQGLGHARNAGLAAATGELVAITDDDVLVDPGWMAALADGCEAARADMVVGRIDPLWLAERPRWLTGDLMGPIISLDWGPARRRYTSIRQPFLGANFAVRRASVTRYGPFDPSLGRRGESLIGGEDGELFRRWLARGAQVVYEPAAVIRHKVVAERVSPRFYRRWFRDIGYTQAHQLDAKWHHALTVTPLWRWRKLLASAGRYGWTRLAPVGEAVRFRAELWWLFERSFLQERLDHWQADLLHQRGHRCRFARAE